MTTVKVFAAIPKRTDLTDQQFHDHWRHPHGTLSTRISTLRRYVQSHRISSTILDTSHPYLGVTELWFDNKEDAANLAEQPAYLQYNAPDEPRFVDVANLKYVSTEEEVLVSRPSGKLASDADLTWSPWGHVVCVKLLQLVETDGNRDWSGLADRALGDAIGALRHVRCHPLTSVHGETPPFLGVRELWWPTVTDFEAGVASDRSAFDELLARGGSSATLLATAERVI